MLWNCDVVIESFWNLIFCILRSTPSVVLNLSVFSKSRQQHESATSIWHKNCSFAIEKEGNFYNFKSTSIIEQCVTELFIHFHIPIPLNVNLFGGWFVMKTKKLHLWIKKRNDKIWRTIRNYRHCFWLYY